VDPPVDLLHTDVEPGETMDFKFHHMNLCSDNLGRLTNFYQTIFNLGVINDGRTRVNDKSKEVGYNGKVDFVSDGAIEFHLAERDLFTGFKMNQFINPMHHGHFCFRTDDIMGFKRRLDELGIRYSDYGIWAVAGWYQIFLHDPDGNIVEVHQPDMH
jgi:catechol 2,3-dioxygenase-like lactoylglutathione lyase family enzyme